MSGVSPVSLKIFYLILDYQMVNLVVSEPQVKIFKVISW